MTPILHPDHLGRLILGHLTRREFLRRTALGAGGIALARSLLGERTWAETASRVVISHCPGVTEGSRTVHLLAVQRMLDRSLLELTDQLSVEAAWRSLLPGLQAHHTVAIKTNAGPAGSRAIPTHIEVVQAIVSGLTRVGLPENQIIIYDRESALLSKAGYRINRGKAGARCFGTDEGDWSYDADQPVEILGARYALSRILTRCDHLINVPVLKVHLDQYGVTLSLKNHYGTVDRPWDLHANFATACATLNAQEAIREKTRLVVIDALFGCWGSLPAAWVVDCTPNRLIVSRDPVAADAVGTQMLNQERTRHGRPPRSVPLLPEAARLGLGVAELDRIDLRRVAVSSDAGDTGSCEPAESTLPRVAHTAENDGRYLSGGVR